MNDWRDLWSKNKLNDAQKLLQNIVTSIDQQSSISMNAWVHRINLLTTRAVTAVEQNQMHLLKDVTREVNDLIKEIECMFVFWNLFCCF